MIVVTTENVPGYRVTEVKGLARGGVVMATHVGRDTVAALRNLVGGEVKEYTEMMAQAREIALNRMIQKAEEMGANAVIGMRFMTSNVGQRMAEVYAFGTAVVLRRE